MNAVTSEHCKWISSKDWSSHRSSISSRFLQ